MKFYGVVVVVRQMAFSESGILSFVVSQTKVFIRTVSADDATIWNININGNSVMSLLSWRIASEWILADPNAIH